MLFSVICKSSELVFLSLIQPCLQFKIILIQDFHGTYRLPFNLLPSAAATARVGRLAKGPMSPSNKEFLYELTILFVRWNPIQPLINISPKLTWGHSNISAIQLSSVCTSIDIARYSSPVYLTPLISSLKAGDSAIGCLGEWISVQDHFF